MLKKRVIFTLLYDSGHFMLSRNFRLQKVGDLFWLQRNYDFSHIAFYIDELVVLDVSRSQRDPVRFCETLRALSKGCFVPIAAGGGVQSVENARDLLHSGADKVVLNSALFHEPGLTVEISKKFGQQCVVGSVDVKREGDGLFSIYTRNGSQRLETDPRIALSQLPSDTIGEIYLNSIDRDGTGAGYTFELLDLLPSNWSAPVILAGGVGNSSHLLAGLLDGRIDAAATAHLFNFVGDGLKNARESLLREGLTLAYWPSLVEAGLSVART
jgi:cyclase